MPRGCTFFINNCGGMSGLNYSFKEWEKKIKEIHNLKHRCSNVDITNKLRRKNVFSTIQIS